MLSPIWTITEEFISICDELASFLTFKVSKGIPQFIKHKHGLESPNLCTSLRINCFTSGQILRIRTNWDTLDVEIWAVSGCQTGKIKRFIRLESDQTQKLWGQREEECARVVDTRETQIQTKDPKSRLTQNPFNCQVHVRIQETWQSFCLSPELLAHQRPDLPTLRAQWAKKQFSHRSFVPRCTRP